MDHPPRFGLGQRTTLFDGNGVTLVKLVFFVVRVILFGQRQVFSVKLIFNTTLYQHGDGLVHLVADHTASEGALVGYFAQTVLPISF
jgi:hypothetical protein